MPYKNILKGILFLAFVVSAIYLPATSEAATIWDKRKQAVEDIIEPAQVAEEIEADVDVAEEVIADLEFDELETAGTIDPSDIYIPDQYGTIIETHKGTNGKLIVHIQDAHANYEGQINTAKILESLIEDLDLTLILPEGQYDDQDYKYLRDRSSLDDRIEVADRLVKDGYFTSINYLDLATDYPTKIRSLEDEDLHDLHAEALWEIDKFKDLAAEYVDKIIIASDSLKPQIYNEGLIEFNSKKKDYDTEAIDLLAYYEYLYTKAEENEIPLYTFPNFQNLMKASAIEKEIDLVKIRSGEASSEDTALYTEYLELTRDLNINALFKEEPMLEDFVVDVLTESSDQKNLLRISKALSIMRNLLRIKVVPEEYKYFVDNKKDFSPGFWTDFVNEQSTKLGLYLNLPSNQSIISDNLAKIEEFYGLAFKRDKIFVEHVNKHMKDENVELAALVAGGFHTPTVTKLLEDNGYSYVVVSPKVTTQTDDELYRWTLTHGLKK